MRSFPRFPSFLFLAALLALPVLPLLWAPPAAWSADEEADPSVLDAVPDGDADAAYRLALELEARDQADLAARAYDLVLRWSPDHPAARRALGYEQVDGEWLKGDELYRARGFIHHDGRWMTSQEFAEATRPEREAAEQKEGEERVWRYLAMIASGEEARVAEARRRMALEDASVKLPPLAKALRLNPPELRIYAAEELGRLGDPLAVPALLKRAIEDEEESVRTAVVAALREIDEPSTVHPLGRALASRYPEKRARAAEALGMLGDELGLPYVIYRWEKRSGDFPRAYFAQTRQISYIQDFDVEVAQTSFIADPIVGVLQEGVVQDVRVLATEVVMHAYERVAYAHAMRDLSGQDFGEDVRAWRRWWNENEDRLIEQRAQRHERQAEAR